MNKKNFEWHIIKNIAELNKISTQWASLIESTTGTPFFSHPDWILNWYNIYWQENWQLYVIVGFHNKKLTVILPSYLQHSTSWPNISTLYPLGQGEPENEEVSSEYCDLIVNSEDLEQVITELAPLILNIKIDQIIWRSVLIDSAINELLTRLFNSPNVITNYQYYIEQPKWSIDLLSKNTRSRYKRACNQFTKLGAKFQWVNPNEYDLYVQNMIEYHQGRWTEKGKLGAFSHKNFQLFHQKLMKLDNGKLVAMSAIIIKNNPIAINYYLASNNTLYFYQCGWDELNYARLSPGLILHLWSITNSQHSIYDFMMGELTDSYKAKYGCDKKSMTNIIIPINKVKLILNKLIKKSNILRT
ncbi:GNAT family N-acetyltransferase [Pseudocolwellia agarivorans]|uniref:GNAT family N-acetyltransferase n=1 Tax=Pseudocolwellia agarivorans TaxID=1911682 RepID=UPI000984FCA5|nr:GNAT family N-acetyltransferase [Pseudocolwellia agarivorans]